MVSVSLLLGHHGLYVKHETGLSNAGVSLTARQLRLVLLLPRFPPVDQVQLGAPCCKTRNQQPPPLRQLRDFDHR